MNRVSIAWFDPGGKFTIADLSEGILQVAVKKAVRLGAEKVEFKQTDACVLLMTSAWN